MYSPKINEDLIPPLYRLAKENGMPMTRLVSQIVREALGKEKGKKITPDFLERSRHEKEDNISG